MLKKKNKKIEVSQQEKVTVHKSIVRETDYTFVTMVLFELTRPARWDAHVATNNFSNYEEIPQCPEKQFGYKHP